MNISNKEIAKQMVYIDWEMLDMGDSYGDTVSYLCYIAGIPYVEFEDDAQEKALSAYEILVEEKPFFMAGLLQNLFDKDFDYLNDIYGKMKFHKETDVNIHPTVIAFKTILEYAEQLLEEGFCSQEFVSTIKSDLKLIFESDIESIQTAYCIGNEYFRYLDRKYFGPVINGCFRTGDIIRPDEREKEPFKNYLYKAHAEFNSSGLSKAGYALFFKRGQVDIYSFSRFRDFYNFDYKKTNCSVALDGDVTEISKQIAEKINAFAKQYAENQKTL